MNKFLLLISALIISSLSYGQISVSGGIGLSATYSSFTKSDGLFAALNATIQTGNNIVVSITSNVTTEDGSIGLNAGNWSSILVSPSGSRTISGNVASSLINLNGADNVTINGLNTGGNSLVISNLSTSAIDSTSTIKFMGDAVNNTITNCSILGSSTTALASNGGTIFFSIGITTGNDNNTISNCKIGPVGTNLPSKGIYGKGSQLSSNIANNNIVINNCEIYNFFLTGGCAGVYVLAGNTDWLITNNKIYQTTSCAFSTVGTMYGIYFGNSTFGNNIQIIGNTIGYANASIPQTGIFTISGVLGSFQGIYLSAMSTASNTCNINNNVISDISFTSSTGTFYGINNTTTASANTININNNVLRNINSAITLNPHYGIYAGSATNLSVCKNTVNSFVRSANGSITAIAISSGTNVKIDTNTISNVSCPGNDAINCIQGAGSSLNINYNHISNITKTLSGSGYINGINITSAANVSANYNIIEGLTSVGSSTIWTLVSSSVLIENYNNNIIRNINSGGTGLIVGLRVFGGSGNKTLLNNQIYSMYSSGGGSIYGIQEIYGSNDNVSGNKIYNLISSGSGTGAFVCGINLGSATYQSVYKNKIYDLSAPNTSGTTSGIYFSSVSTTINLYNNIIGDLRAPASSQVSPKPSIEAVHLYGYNSNINAYYNTIYLNATSTGLDFGTAAIYSVFNPFTLNLRNNILVNTSIPNGTGKTIAVKIPSLLSYLSTSNNNLFYVETPGPNYKIMYDGTNYYETLNDFQTAVAPRDAASISEYPNWLTTIGSSSRYLHINPRIPSAIDNGGVNISGITDDFDGNIRAGNPGYSVLEIGTAPDMGADEFGLTLCNGAYGGIVSGAGSFCTSGSPVLIDTGYFFGINSDYQWQSSSDSLFTIPIDILGQTNPDILNAPVITSTTYYRLKAMCTTGGQIDYSNVVKVNVYSIPNAPSGLANQYFCTNNLPKVLDLSATGNNILWYDSNISSTVLLGTTSLVNSTHYYASQTVNGCESINRLDVYATINISPEIVIVTGGGAQCGGSLQLNASGGLGGSIYWQGTNNGGTSNAQLSSQESVSTSGTYYFRSLSLLGCWSYQGSAQVTIYPIITSVGITTINPTCYNGSNGSITLNAIGGSSPYKYSKDNGVLYSVGTNPYTFDNLYGAYNYYITVKDSNSCVFNYGLVTLTYPPDIAISSIDTSVGVVTCYNGNDGWIRVHASGGNGTYSYSDDNGVNYSSGTSNYTFTGLSSNNYNIVVKDGNNCIKNYTNNPVRLTQLDTLSAKFRTTMTSCISSSDGSITFINQSGGSGSWNYSINGGTSWQTSASFIGLASGTYNVAMQDAVNLLCTRILGSVYVEYPDTANAGPNQNIIGSWEAIMQGSEPAAGIGTWIRLSGIGNASFLPNANTYNARAIVDAYGTYTFRWTLVSGSCTNFDEVNVSYTAASASTFSNDGNWNNYLKWDNGVPSVITNATINGNAIVSENAVCSKLIINAGNSLLINFGKTLNVNDSLILKSDGLIGNSAIIDKGTINYNSSKTIMQIYVRGGNQRDTMFRYFSSPINNSSINVFNLFNMFHYNETSNSFVSNNINDQMTNALGYSGHYIGSVTVNPNITINYKGAFNTGNKTTNLSRSNFSSNSPNSNNFNLIGNPYPSPIDLDSITLNNVEPTVYFWNGTGLNAGNYGIYNINNGISTLGAQHIMPAGQGFFVRASAASSSVSFSINDRITSTQPLYKALTIHPNHLRLNVEGENFRDEAIVGFMQGATTEFDGLCDAIKLSGGYDLVPMLYTRTASGSKLVVNEYPLLLSGRTEVIPLEFVYGANGTFTINASDLSSFSNDISVKLEDLKTMQMINLKNFNTHNFIFNANDIPHRFNLHFIREVDHTGIDEVTSNVNIYNYNNTIYISSDNIIKANIFVYNVLGQEVVKTKMENTTLFAVNANEFISGYYLVKVISSNKTITVKVYIN